MDLPYYENVYIKHIEVHTPKTFKPLGFISGNTLVNPLDFTSSLDLSNNDIKHYRGFIPIDGCAGNLFFIVVKVSGGTEVNLPCVTKQDVIVGVTYDK